MFLFKNYIIKKMKRKRDALGRFAKSVEANDNIIITLPHFKTVIVYLI